jgi:23S rRNA (cytidine1920-2'-O)/16S rRNA (cytidine1409-2'-O)-methyltransferase
MKAEKISRERLDVLVHERGFSASRSRAQALIRAGLVNVDGQRMDKPGMSVPRSAIIEVKQRLPFVGRGGLKMKAALEAFDVDPSGLACIDVGASTGGFTDCLLQNHARIVYAVDVGRAQLDWKLRNDPRVVSMERTDIRGLPALPEPMDLAVVDVAFISLLRVLPSLQRHLRPSGRIIALVKPQFEVGRERVGRGGIVRDPALRREVLESVLTWAAGEGWMLRGVCDSPISGQGGNREFLVLLSRDSGDSGPPLDIEASLIGLEGLQPIL